MAVTTFLQYTEQSVPSSIITDAGHLYVAKMLSIEKGVNDYGETYATLRLVAEGGTRFTIDLDERALAALKA